MKECSKIILFASANDSGNTKMLVDRIFAQKIPILNLNQYKLSFFSYDQKYPEEDQFNKIFTEILKHDHLIIASPTYWYSVCAQMKVFLDRLSDLFYGSKDRLIRLRTKSISFITTFGTDSPLGCVGVEEQVINTAKYLKVNYIHGLIYYTGDNEQLSILNNLKEESYKKAIDSL